MKARAQLAVLADGRRHFHDGPIDLILEAFGEKCEVEVAYQAAALRFVDVLDELCAELPLLRTPKPSFLQGRVARKMARAVAPFQQTRFLTPMAAVAGAVAEEILGAMTSAADLRRAYVNNGGDIALHLQGAEIFSVGMIDRPDRPSLFGRATISASDSARGIATSGWRGRSFSLGIADAVTVIAQTAALADAAATLIANAVDLPGNPAIAREPARHLDPQSDLGERLVTRDVGPLSDEEIARALQAGGREAADFRRRGLIEAAALRLGANTHLVGGGQSCHPRERGDRIHTPHCGGRGLFEWQNIRALGPSPLAGEGGRRPDEGSAPLGRARVEESASSGHDPSSPLRGPSPARGEGDKSDRSLRPIGGPIDMYAQDSRESGDDKARSYRMSAQPNEPAHAQG